MTDAVLCFRNVRDWIYLIELAPELTIRVLVAQWLERLTGHQKFGGLIPVWGSEIVFLSIGLDDHSSILRYIQALTFLKHKTENGYSWGRCVNTMLQ